MAEREAAARRAIELLRKALDALGGRCVHAPSQLSPPNSGYRGVRGAVGVRVRIQVHSTRGPCHPYPRGWAGSICKNWWRELTGHTFMGGSRVRAEAATSRGGGGGGGGALWDAIRAELARVYTATAASLQRMLSLAADTGTVVRLIVVQRPPSSSCLIEPPRLLQAPPALALPPHRQRWSSHARAG